MHSDRDDEPFSGLLLRHRGRTGLTQRQLAARIGVNMRSVQGWETGVSYPGATRLQALIVAFLESSGLTPGHEAEEAEALWAAVEREASRTHPPFEHAWFASLLEAHASTRMPEAPPAASQPDRSPVATSTRAEAVGNERQLDW